MKFTFAFLVFLVSVATVAGTKPKTQKRAPSQVPASANLFHLDDNYMSLTGTFDENAAKDIVKITLSGGSKGDNHPSCSPDEDDSSSSRKGPSNPMILKGSGGYYTNEYFTAKHIADEWIILAKVDRRTGDVAQAFCGHGAWIDGTYLK